MSSRFGMRTSWRMAGAALEPDGPALGDEFLILFPVLHDAHGRRSIGRNYCADKDADIISDGWQCLRHKRSGEWLLIVT